MLYRLQICGTIILLKDIKNFKNYKIMAGQYTSELESLRAEQEETFNGNGTAVEFLDMLDEYEKEIFRKLEILAEERKKWLKQYEKLQNKISNRDFDEAYELLEVISTELPEFV